MKKRSIIPIVLLMIISSLISSTSYSRRTTFYLNKNTLQKNIGLQLYSIRDSIGKDVPAAIAKVGKMGYKFVEPAGYADGKFYGMEPVAFKALCESNGMKVLSSHVGKDLPSPANMGKTMAWWDTCINAHVEAGAKFLVQPSMESKAYRNLDTLKRYCDYFNLIGEKCNAKGIRFGYHNHDKEFSTKLDGQTIYDFMLANTDPAKVMFEMDLYWTVVGGANPVDYFEKYPGRFELWHIKDKEELGASGMMDFASIWKAAAKSGMQYGIVEVEKYNFDQYTSCKMSLDFLNAAPYVVMPSVQSQIPKKPRVSGSSSQLFHKWAPTPPMGWNSWDCYGPTVVEDEVKANADYMAKNLKKFGWEYIVVDIRWYVSNDKSGGYNEKDPVYNMDNYGRFLPAVNRFPSSANGNGFKPLGDYIHKKGLKFGIHMMRGIPVLAVKKNTPILGSKATAQEIYSTEGQCPWLKDMYTIVAGKPGAQEYYNSLFQLYASWGLDFIKVDDLSNRPAEIEMVRKAIDNCGRKIVISISPGGDKPEAAEFLKNNVNMWRTSNDFWDNWPALKNQFSVLNSWAGLGGKGYYPDGDMLPLGKIGLRAERGKPRMTGFTKDEQYTLMTLFAIFRSPLMFGGDLPGNDGFTLSLITNKDVLNVNQHSINGKQLFRQNDLIAWTAEDPEKGDKYLALFNISDKEQSGESKTESRNSASITVKFDLLGLTGTHEITDLWSGKKLGKFSNEFTQTINRHGAGLFRIH